MLSRWLRGYRNEILPKVASGSGTGDVLGPSTSADNTLARYNGTNNKTIQGSPIIVDDSGAFYEYLAKINVQTDNYATVNADTGKVIEMNVGTAKNLTLHATAPVGSCLTIVAKGVGQVTVISTGSGTVVNASTQFKTRAQYSVLGAYVTANAGGSAAIWILSGDTAA